MRRRKWLAHSSAWWESAWGFSAHFGMLRVGDGSFLMASLTGLTEGATV